MTSPVSAVAPPLGRRRVGVARVARVARAALAGEAGQVAGIEALPFGVLTFVVGILLVANAWGVVDAKGAATAAAREGTRAYVEAASAGDAAEAAGVAARRALDGHGRSGAAAEVTIDAAGFRRCAPVTVIVRTEVPAVRLPWIGGVGGSYTVTGRHRELIDPYRSGDLEAGRCG